MQGIPHRIAGRFFLVAALLGSPLAAAETQVTGRFSHIVAANDRTDIDFTCTGEPTCTGSYHLTDRVRNCSNIVEMFGGLTITGLDLGRSGAISGNVTLRDLPDHDPDAQGVCFIIPGSHANVTVPFTGQWDGTNGSLSLVIDGYVFSGAFKADRSAPPPVFPMTVRATIGNTATAVADIQFRPRDVGTQGSVYVFAMAPASRVIGGTSQQALRLKAAAGPGAKAETPIGCVLAQLNASGQMVAVSSANLAAYLTGVLSAQGASVSILNGVPTSNVSGATFFVGYGPNATSMLNNGVNRAAVTVPGSLECRPSRPQTGWWWNPAEDGRGFSLEVRGNNLFFASFLYDVSGRSTWYVSTGPVSLEGTLYNGDLLGARGGQTLGGAYPGFPTLASVGAINLTFNNESTGTLIWPGGTVPIQRFNIIPNGLNLQAVEGQPESGWWWNEQEAGRGFFLEFQNGWLDIAGYMYDDQGNSVWYLTVGQIAGAASARTFSGSWWSYANGQALTGPWRQNTRTSSNVAPLSITFTGVDTAVMTLPNNRTTTLRRHRF